MTRLIVGLGNPGPEYVDTRHNVGFRVVERIAADRGLLFQSASRLEGYRGRKNFTAAQSGVPLGEAGSCAPRDFVLVKPLTWMNLSGEAVAPLASWAQADPEDVLVVYDDLDLPFGDLRLRPFGGAGGHNGMRSIIDELGSDRFPRMRVGIGRPRTDAARYVLEPFASDEREEIEISIAEASEAILFWLGEGDLDECMARFHSRWKAARGD